MDDLNNRIGTVEHRDTNHTYAVDSLTNRYTTIDAAPIFGPYNTGDKTMKPIPSRWKWMCLAAVIFSGTVNAMYCPQAGRFLQQDPIGYVDGLNLYEYVGSSPGNRNDPKGTDFIAIADRPVQGTLVFYHYSLQYWRCCNPQIPLTNELYHTSSRGDGDAELKRICTGTANKLEGFELLADSGWKVWAKASADRSNALSSWIIDNVSIAYIHFEDKSMRLMPILTGTRTQVKGQWDAMKEMARNYPWAEQQDDLKSEDFKNWTRSLYDFLGTNSNTFVRHISGPLMSELPGSHPGDYYPQQNTKPYMTYYSWSTPWQNTSAKPCPGQ